MNVMITREAAKMLGISAIHIRTLIRQGTLPAKKFGRDWLIKRADVKELAKQDRPRKHRPVGRPRKSRKKKPADGKNTSRKK